jgi:hypothetical protein
VCLEHLSEVLGLERLSVLDDLPGRAKPELFVSLSGGVGARKRHPHHERQQAAETMIAKASTAARV